MTLDEAIAHAREVAEENREMAELISNRPLEVCDIHRKEDKCLECAKEHEQLASWLEELKARQESDKSGDLISREALKKEICVNTPISIDETWEQLYDAVVKAIDNAPTVEPRDSFDLGYIKGLEDGKDKLIKELWNCRNELCLRCGKYEKAHRGACDDCRYNFKNMEQYKRGDNK